MSHLVIKYTLRSKGHTILVEGNKKLGEQLSSSILPWDVRMGGLSLVIQEALDRINGISNDTFELSFHIEDKGSRFNRDDVI